MRKYWLGLFLVTASFLAVLGWGVLVSMLLSSTAKAETYCIQASTAFVLYPLDTAMDTIQSVCQPGDILPLPSDKVGAIAFWCDFDKEIIATREWVLCRRLDKKREQR